MFAAILIILTNLGAGASVVFFNSYLSDITTEDKRDKVSSWGFASGYLGGIATMVIGSAIMFKADALGITLLQAERISFLIAGIWWGGFAIFTFVLLRNRTPVRSAPSNKGYVAAGLTRVTTSAMRPYFAVKSAPRMVTGSRDSSRSAGRRLAR